MKYLLYGEDDYLFIKVRDDEERTYTLLSFDLGRILRWYGLSFSTFVTNPESQIGEDHDL